MHCTMSLREQNQLVREQAHLAKDGLNYKVCWVLLEQTEPFSPAILVSSILILLVEFRGRNPFWADRDGGDERKAKSSWNCIINNYLAC